MHAQLRLATMYVTLLALTLLYYLLLSSLFPLFHDILYVLYLYLL